MSRKIKPLIYVFCEGESEIEYTNFLKEKFSDVSVIQKPVKGLFEVAEKKFKKTPKFVNNIEVTDEIWFFFDVDDGQTGSWEKNKKIISSLEKLRKKPKIRVRLLMTTGYEKGDPVTTRKIAENLDDAITNGKWVLEHVDGMPTLEDNDIRNQWLYQSGLTFTTVQEAMGFLQNM